MACLTAWRSSASRPPRARSAGRSAGERHLHGVVLLIALPTLRGAVMAAWLALRRYRDLALVAMLVLASIVAATLLGAAGT